MSLSHSRLRELLNYCPETGVFTWRISNGNRRAGSVAGTVASCGYRYISVADRKFIASRLAWFWMTGERPRHTIDHINGDSCDDRWRNLRQATYSQQNANRSVFKTSQSGVKGVSRERGKWRARINQNGRRIRLGPFATMEEADAAYIAASKVSHGDYSVVVSRGGAR